MDSIRPRKTLACKYRFHTFSREPEKATPVKKIVSETILLQMLNVADGEADDLPISVYLCTEDRLIDSPVGRKSHAADLPIFVNGIR